MQLTNVPACTSVHLVCFASTVGKRGIVMSVTVCLFVCLSIFVSVCPRAYLRSHTYYTDFITKFTVHVFSGRSSIFLWWRCNTLCIVNDAMFCIKGLVAV